MRILLVGNYTQDQQFSMLAYARMLREGLHAKGHDVRLISPEIILGRLPFFKKWLGYIDKFILFIPKLMRAARVADVVHVCDHSNAMYIRWIEKKPHLITCHDLFAVRSAWGEVAENRVRFTGRIFQKLNFSGLRRAKKIVAVSPATARDLAEWAKIRPDKIAIIDNGLNYPYQPMLEEEARVHLKSLAIAPGQPYLLHVGKTSFYKNHRGLFNIFYHMHRERPDLRLVTVGAKFDSQLTALIDELGLAAHIHPLSNLGNEDLRALYSSAQALLFPSLMEGFGWPVIEAQACGCPVFASDRPPLPYVGGSAAAYFDPEKPEVAARLILGNWNRRTEMAAAGLVNVCRFDPGLMLDRIISEYSVACGKRVEV